MKLIEVDAKKLLTQAGIRVPTGTFLSFNDASSVGVTFPLFAKAQVVSGRRGKRGLVKRVSESAAFPSVLQEIRTAVADEPCAGVLLETEATFKELWLVSIDLDRSAGAIRATVSPSGGMDVSVARSVFVYSDADLGSLDAPKPVQDLLKVLLEAFRKNDALSMEINPLAILEDGSVMALDAKVELDDSAAFRHPEWSELTTLPGTHRPLSERERAYAHLLEAAGHRGTLGKYVELDGDIALILSGGGASLVALDALAAAGGRAANYVEMSGNPDVESVRAASRVVLAKPGIRAVWIAGSFANFTDIQATVGAVRSTIEELGLRVPIVIRRDGPNTKAAQEETLRWGSEHGVTVRFDRADVDLHESALAVVAAAKNV
ncbi:MAG: ATP citrate lyase citrate-binding domain-containing protein [Patescibacteria group bacterium]|jgi:succinyl-CoA synthetase beta subunit